MRGDFSCWKKEKSLNFRGTLHQQGRVLLDRDWNAQTEIFNDWQEIAARDTIGASVAAIPADAAESFKVTKAEIIGSEVVLSVNPGRVWADGLLIELKEKNIPATGFKAEYLAAPIQDPKAETPKNPPNTPRLRDAVILETWLEELNAFQAPNLLIEPALGGIDTTERVQTVFRFRLFRMKDGDTCTSIAESLKDKFSNKGKLRATLQPNIPTGGDCPIVEGGGYTGFEHQLYRIEIAESDIAGAWFKWSQYNGGLVGRGRFDSVNKKVDIKANRNAIINSGLTNFYLEALEFKAEINCWRVIYGAQVSLDSNNMLSLPASAQIGSIPSPKEKPYFFRLWNGIEKIGDWTVEKDLQDGIRLQFEADAAGKYTPGDYWTFPVRAGEIKNKEVLFESKPPEGIYYHRVPLAELTWRDGTLTEADVELEDCRQIFQPLTKLKGCCSYRVGDGIDSHGDFKSISQAISALPKEGGEICILPGTFRENVVLSAPHNRNITIKGCGSRSRIVAAKSEPVIYAAGGTNLQIKSLAIEAHDEAVGILLEGDEIVAGTENSQEKFGRLREVELDHLQITAAKRSAIEMHVGQFVAITDCKIAIKDEDNEWAAIYLAGDDLLVERNEIRVINNRLAERTNLGGQSSLENDFFKRLRLEKDESRNEDPAEYQPARRASGGLHLSGGCERVCVRENLIIGGTGNGISLGSVDVLSSGGITVKHTPWHTGNDHDQGECNPNPGFIGSTEIGKDLRYIAGLPLRDISIERNRIFSMGRNGIGVYTFFVIETLSESGGNRSHVEFIGVENLSVIGNRIEFCLNRPPVDIPEAMTDLMGYGGIALSTVETLVIRDNFINDNGASFLNATCGIFILHGTGIEISRNHILNNGRLTIDKPTQKTIKNGARGGIFIRFALDGARHERKPTGNLSTGIQNFSQATVPNGLPALRLCENVVAVPLGRALTVESLGTVAVSGNHFTSYGIVPGLTLDFLAASIFILSFNISGTLGDQPTSFSGIKDGQLKVDPKLAQSAAKAAAKNKSKSKSAGAESARFNAVLFSGAVQFSNNRCELFSSFDEPVYLAALTAILIVSLDDVSFLGNQTKCLTGGSPLVVDTMLFGMTVRAAGNYWQETLGSVVLSALTVGWLNTTTDNHAVFCVSVWGLLYVNRYNLTIMDFALGCKNDAMKIDMPTPCENLLKDFFAGFVKAQQSPGSEETPPPTTQPPG